MTRSLLKLLFLSFLVVAGSIGIYVYRAHFSADQKIIQLEHEKKQLQDIVQRLGDERRVADMLVTDQTFIDGVKHTKLLFEEYARDGSRLPPKELSFAGEMAHIDAMVIKFDHDLVYRNDPLRGHSIALFVRIYGDHQTPEQAMPIDPPGGVPDIYRGQDPAVSSFEQSLWAQFWQLADDPSLRLSRGVRVANGDGKWFPAQPDILYTITIETDGGMNLAAEPVRGIFLEALHRHGTL